jgi:hypothetical protein
MFGHHDLGRTVYKTWDETQRREEIARLVDGYRNGLPIGILCKMAETIAGNRKKARTHLQALLTDEERRAAVAGEIGGMQILAREFLL